MSMSHTEAAAAQPQGNPGEILRLAREERGWQLAEVAAQLNLTSHSLSQLEAGAFERLPGHTFARGYIRAYAKLLGLDPAALVEAFDRHTGTSSAAGSQVQSLGRVVEPRRLSRTLLRLASAALLALLVLLGYFWWQERPERLSELGMFGLQHIEVDSADGTTQLHPVEEPEDQAVAEAQAPAQVALEPVESAPASADAGIAVVEASAVPAPAPAGEPAQPQPQPQPPAAADAAVQPASAVPVETGTTGTAVPVAEPVAPAAPAVTPGQGLVQLGFSADCWVQVSEAGGRVLISTVKRKGESLEIAGKAPLELRLGNARGATEVRYNGVPVEHLKNLTASGTARINLGQ